MSDDLSDLITNYVAKSTAQHILNNIEYFQRQENTMCWNDIRKKLPEEDQECLIAYKESEDNYIIHRAIFTEGTFRSLENESSFPLSAQFWLAIPEIEE
uniref:DUF551 domain-containing protein n=1 Tax=uncultured Caudovirales phage TaxID=2100421 RepID=A0A6J5KVJ6_9CAUD|nr:hypothetical protein UFOVP88_57 [uncultured Caudovirales phage]